MLSWMTPQDRRSCVIGVKGCVAEHLKGLSFSVPLPGLPGLPGLL